MFLHNKTIVEAARIFYPHLCIVNRKNHFKHLNMTTAQIKRYEVAITERTIEVSEKAYAKVQQILVAAACIGFFPLMYLIGTAVTNLIR